MACSEGSAVCRPCNLRDATQEAIFWCLVCKEGLCTGCKKYHRVSEALKFHEVVPYKERENLPAIAREVRETCDEHNRKFEVYCSDHEEVCCVKCSTLNHRNCTNLSPLDEIISNVKSSVALNNLEESLNAIISKIKVIETKKEDFTKNTENQVVDVKKHIDEMKSQFEDAVTSLHQKVDKLKQREEENTQNSIRYLREKRKVIEDIKVSVSQIKANGSNLQLFLCLKELESKINHQESLLSKEIENGEYEGLELQFEPNREIKDVITTGAIGELKVETKSLDLRLQSLGQTAKLANKVTSSRNINEIQLKKKMQMTLPSGSKTTVVTNCVILHNNTMIFTDFSDNARLMLFDGNGQFLRSIQTESNPFDITIVEESVVAITLPKMNKFVFLELLHKEEIVKTIVVVGECYGIDHSGDRIAVAVKNYGINIFDSSGKELKIIPFACTVVAFSRSNICYVQMSTEVLRCCDFHGKNIWEICLSNFYDYPSLTVDHQGNIYLAERYTDSVYVLSYDGTISKKILSRSNGLYNNNGLCFNAKTSQLLLCTKRDTEAVLYDVL